MKILNYQNFQLFANFFLFFLRKRKIIINIIKQFHKKKLF